LLLIVQRFALRYAALLFAAHFFHTQLYTALCLSLNCTALHFFGQPSSSAEQPPLFELRCFNTLFCIFSTLLTAPRFAALLFCAASNGSYLFCVAQRFVALPYTSLFPQSLLHSTLYCFVLLKSVLELSAAPRCPSCAILRWAVLSYLLSLRCLIWSKLLCAARRCTILLFAHLYFSPLLCSNSEPYRNPSLNPGIYPLTNRNL
jgi:hypothetical protein